MKSLKERLLKYLWRKMVMLPVLLFVFSLLPFRSSAQETMDADPEMPKVVPKEQ